MTLDPFAPEILPTTPSPDASPSGGAVFSTTGTTHDVAASARHLRGLLAPYDLVIVPGLHDSGPRHWQSHWHALLPSRRVRQADWDQPRWDMWVTGLERTLAHCHRPVVFVAHSLGAVLVARWGQQQTRVRVAGALLVAPADLRGPRARQVPALRDFAFPSPSPLPFPARIIASTDDEWLSPHRAGTFTAAWGAPLIGAGRLGHIGNMSPLGAWAQGLDWFRDFLATLPPPGDASLGDAHPGGIALDDIAPRARHHA
ncbi:RBBP9/YdeN family alpha/beta hydrolase [Novacetimonas pomaceti]|uniref:RBBP9/YdeN family alpha/beta hydrolase n=1 Tax=Novacetimonas pomaceti TaxID=2021998 RepID=UPI001C2DBDCA|nr:alpha/beta hydrolase [Novacetimonas pomaceti]MBV1833909.1 alpha/beta hydrolase [Novacetimonas pomaceti]